MNVKRIARGFLFYIAGLAIGSFLVYQFWIKNRTDLPNMWPEGRVRDKIYRSQFLWDDTASCYASCYTLNDSLIKNFVNAGNVRFGISETRKKPNPVYVIDGFVHESWNVRMTIESGDSTSVLKKIEDLPDTKNAVNCQCP